MQSQEISNSSYFNPLIRNNAVLPWILRARYALAGAQCAVFLTVHFVLGFKLPLRWLGMILFIEIASNVALSFGAHRRELDEVLRRDIFFTFLFDVVVLSAILALTGGPANPFSLLYLVQISVSAVVLTKGQTWVVGFASILGYASLFLWSRPIVDVATHMHESQVEKIHLLGMWVSFVCCSVLITYFAGHVSEMLRLREAELREAGVLLEKKQRLAAMATLAGGAAHELANPLATIAVIVSDLEEEAVAENVRSDLALIRQEVMRCKAILENMSRGGAEMRGESLREILPEELIAPLEDSFPDTQFTILNSEHQTVYLPVHSVRQGLSNLIQNAVDAAPASNPRVSVNLIDGVFEVVVIDFGGAIPPDVLQRIGEPFFTTKAKSDRIGLGTFLVRAVAEELGGSLTYTSSQRGTQASFVIPQKGPSVSHDA